MQLPTCLAKAAFGTFLVFSALLAVTGCARHHTLESTAHMTRSELLRLCEDLRVRAEQDCRWNVEEQQSSISNRQTWEINCMARRDSARESFENVCHPSRFGAPVEREEQ